MNGIKRLVDRLVSPQPLLCIGHSHTDMVVAAAAEAGVPLKCLNFWVAQEWKNRPEGSTELPPQIRSQLVPPVFSLIGGAVHDDIGLLVHPRPFDFVWPERPNLPLSEGAEIVPYGAVLAAMRIRVKHFLDVMAEVRAATDGPVFHFESPPINAEDVVPLDDPKWVAFCENRPIAPAWFRFKLWSMQSAIVRASCADHGIVFVPHPAEAVDRDGFLTTEFRGKPAHANKKYGALVLRQMQSLARGEPFAHRLRRKFAGRNGVG